MVMSGRAMGKTYATTSLIVKKFLKTGKQTVYLRRTATQIDNVKDTFFRDMEKAFPDHEFKVDGYTGYIDDRPAIYFIPVSTGPNEKGAEYPDVDLILWDEYIETKSQYTGKYLRNEMILFFDLVNTIFRYREELQRIIILSNSVSYVCPLFSFFDIEPDPTKKFQSFKNGLITLELYHNENFVKEIKNRPFSKLLEGTPYYAYAIDNQVLEDTKDFVKNKPDAKYSFICEIKVDGYKLGLWFNLKDSSIYVDEKIDNTNIDKYVIYNDDLTQGYSMIKDYRKTWKIKEIRNCFNNGKMFYCNQEIKKLFMDRVIKYI
jgi:hypothetical protein